MEAGQKTYSKAHLKIFSNDSGYYEEVYQLQVAVVGYDNDFSVYTGAVSCDIFNMDKPTAIDWVVHHGDKKLSEKEARELFPECNELSFRG